MVVERKDEVGPLGYEPDTLLFQASWTWKTACTTACSRRCTSGSPVLASTVLCYGSHWQQIGFQVSLSWDRRDEAHCGGRLIYVSSYEAIQPIARMTSYTIQQPNCNTPTTPSVDTWSKATLFNRLDCRRQGDKGSILVGCTEGGFPLSFHANAVTLLLSQTFLIPNSVILQKSIAGNDPGTDLRGVGMFGLLQLLYLASSPHLMPLARDIYRVSLDEQQNFPLAVLSLNMTRMALQTLRQGLLNRECNERHMVVEVLNEFYAAIFCHTLHIWTSQHKTIRDSGYVLKGWSISRLVPLLTMLPLYYPPKLYTFNYTNGVKYPLNT
ncbi:unnamed protein product [Timema podura]|uniref:ELMO domain-containing protein n=1 Tax=Timema podura TaxID=61482 RepID=A0ABN7P8Q1_TIMPD|nr:unnamed protein product [Timema podura]